MIGFVASTVSTTGTLIAMIGFVAFDVSTKSLFSMTSVFRSFRSLHSLRFLRSSYPHPYYQDPGRFFRPNEPALEECQRLAAVMIALRQSAKATTALPLRGGAPRKSLRFYGYEADE